MKTRGKTYLSRHVERTQIITVQSLKYRPQRQFFDKAFAYLYRAFFPIYISNYH